LPKPYAGVEAVEARRYLARLERLRRELLDEKRCMLVVADESSVFYLTGYRGAGVLALGRERALLLVPVLEYLSALDQLGAEGLLGDVEVVAYAPYGLPGGLVAGEAVEVVEKHPLEAASSLLGCRSCGLAASAHSVWEAARGKCEDVEDVSKHISEMRMVKEPWEIERMRAAAEIAEAALEKAIEALHEGVSESEIAGLLYYEMRRLGAEDYSFPPIVAFGVNSVYPHAQPSHRRRLKSHTPVLIDLGAKYMGYSSDMTRTLFYGSSSPPEFRHVAEGVLDAVNAALDVVRDGVEASEVDAAARRVLEKYGLSKYFIHSLGHGIGIDVHEPPRVTFNSKTVLREGMVITIEPGVYIPGRYGIRIEEMVLVSRRRGIRLTSFEQKLW